MTATHSLSVLDIKSASLDVLSMLLRSADPELLRNELSARLARRPKAFASEPFLLDVSALDDSLADALPQLCALLQSQGVRIIGVRHSSAADGDWKARAQKHTQWQSPEQAAEELHVATDDLPPVHGHAHPSLDDIAPVDDWKSRAQHNTRGLKKPRE